MAVSWVRPSSENDFIPAVLLGLVALLPGVLLIYGLTQGSVPWVLVGVSSLGSVLALLHRIRRRAMPQTSLTRVS
jgi:hypothetical protein